jgi:hypothetical protein
LLDHEATPASVLALWVHHGRLAISTATDLWLSQSQAGASGGVYYDSVVNIRHPRYWEMGWRRAISGNEGYSSGSIQRIVGIEGRTLLMYESAVFVLSGTDAPTFDLRRWQGEEQLGPIGPRNITIWRGRVWYRAADGIRSFDFDRGTHREDGIGIERLLSPASLFAGTNYAGNNAILAIFTGLDRLFISYQSAVSTYHLLEFDGRSGWHRWATTNPIYGGAVFSGGDDTNDLYVWDSGGQFYKIGGSNYGDTATQAAGVTGVAIAVQSRDYTGEGILNAERLGATIYCASTSTITFEVEGDDPAQAWSQAYTLGAGRNNIPHLKVSGRVRGKALRWRISATDTDAIRIERVSLLASPGARL